MTKIIAISDLHGNLPKLPASDLLLIAGDLCPTRDHSIPRQFKWIRDEFIPWLDSQCAVFKVFIAGNHDFVFESFGPEAGKGECAFARYLQDSGTEFNGLKIWGSPWQPVFCNWAFNLTEPQLSHKWAQIPDDTDILVTHGPPQGVGDTIEEGSKYLGSWTLTERIETLPNLKLHVFGHIHGGFGVYDFKQAKLANVSYVDEQYNPREKGWLEIEL